LFDMGSTEARSLAFEAVTRQASPCQILKRGRSPMFFRNHLVCFVWLVHICFVDETVFTASLRTFANLLP
jgi:hypothetical protein